MRPRVLVSAVAAVLVVMVGLWALAWRQRLAPEAPPPRAAFDATQVERGRYVAAAAGCGACHTATGGVPYAGGAAVKTPGGIVYGSNITPDPEHGIGRWSLAAFTRAVRDGVSPDGHRLRPLAPYRHFPGLPDADVAALYAFLMTRDPVGAPAIAAGDRAPRRAVAFRFGRIAPAPKWT